MASYIALARKWRPAQFADVVGQAHIIRTLTNAVRLDRIHHAYVFTGCRGIGKTSIARIFSKVLRCNHTRIENDLIASCDECPDCLEITAGNSVNMIEIDGASNNGVEAIREIRDSSRYMPSNGARKIYLIDEVHMLTTAAFNALLKTLEEPPAHVIFIFATTEPHKIPARILSRTQRFDYRRVSAKEIQDRLSLILDSEKVQAEPSSVALISRAADGSLRDALSLLDQVIAYCGNSLTIQGVRECVGLVEGQTLIQILDSVFKRQPQQAATLIESVYQQGHDLRVLARGLIEFLHATILAKIGTQDLGSVGLELASEEWEQIRALSHERSLEEMELFFQVLHQGLEWIARSPQPKIVLTVLLIKCATAHALMEIQEPTHTRSSSTQGLRSHTPSAPMYAAGGATQSSTPPRPVNQIQGDRGPITPVSPTHTQPAGVGFTPAQTAGYSSLVTAPATATTPATTANSPAGENLAKNDASTSQDMNPTNPTHPAASTNTLHPGAPEQFIGHVRTTRPLLASILEHGSCSLSQDGKQFLVYFSPQDAYFKEQLHSKVYAQQLGELAKAFFGKPVHFKIELKDTGESMAAKKDREMKKRADLIRQKAETHPTIVEAKALFGGELTPISIRGETHAQPPR